MVRGFCPRLCRDERDGDRAHRGNGADPCGLVADVFAARRFEQVTRWSGPNGVLSLPMALTQWDLYSLFTGVIGVYAIHRLSLIEEHGEIERRAMVAQVLDETRRTIRNISSVAGLRAATDLPGALLRDARLRMRLRRGQARKHLHVDQ